MDQNALIQARRLPGFLSGEVHCQPAPPGSPFATPSGRALLVALALLPALLTAACSGNRRPAPPSGPIGSGIERGTASWYGPGFNGHRTANGERYNMRELTAAHQT